MVSTFNAIAFICAITVFWLIDMSISYIIIKHSTKRSKTKLKEDYPYFSFNLIKRVFCLGLKGAVPTLFVIVTFATNIAVILFDIIGIVYVCIQILFLSLVFRYFGFFVFVLILLRLAYFGIIMNSIKL